MNSIGPVTYIMTCQDGAEFKMAPETTLPRPRDMKLDDLKDVASVHKNCFPDSISIFSALSDETVMRFYAQAVRESESFAAVLEDPVSQRIVGLCIGTMKNGFQGRFLRRNLFRFTRETLYAFLINPRVRNSIGKRLRSFLKSRLKKSDQVTHTRDERFKKALKMHYLSLAVHSQWRGKGNAQQLVNYFSSRIFEEGADLVYGFISVDNVPSIKVHERLGWNIKMISDKTAKIWMVRSGFDCGKRDEHLEQ